MSPRRLGVLGGAFNPPHLGHLVLAQEAAAQLGLERVLLVPVGRAPHRRIEPEPGPEVRLEMVRAAVRDDTLLEASEVEVRRPGPSYTYETLEEIAGSEADEEIWFLMGADAASAIADWKLPERVLELARIGIAARGEAAVDEAEAAIRTLAGERRSEVVSMPAIGVSSTDVRERIGEGRPARYLVPDRVLEIVGERELYR